MLETLTIISFIASVFAIVLSLLSAKNQRDICVLQQRLSSIEAKLSRAKEHPTNEHDVAVEAIRKGVGIAYGQK